MQKQTRYSIPNCLGSDHHRTKDAEVREELEDLEFGVIAIRHDAPLSTQVAEHESIFGSPSYTRV